MSYHNRNLPALATIEMSPGLWFMRLQKSWLNFLVESLVSKDDSKRAAGCDGIAGMGARGKGDGQEFDCATWLHKARDLSKEDFRQAVESELTGK